MNLFDRLRHVTLHAQTQDDLPDFLAARLFRIADDPNRYSHRHEELLALIELVKEYDTYGQTGYIGMGVDHVVLGQALDRLEA